jgi:chromosomal replication initiation ATPase DnaA
VQPQQLALDLGTVTAATATVVTPSNAAAAHALAQWPRWPHPVLVLTGPAGSGKTHFARLFAERTLGRYVAGADLAAADVLALVAAPVAVDDIGRSDERALFHLVNAARAAGQALLLAGDRGGVALPDLASRLNAAPEVALAAPDDALLRRVLVGAFQARQLPADPAVVAFLAARMERTLHAAHDAVAAIDRAGLERRRGPTRGLAARALEAADAG